MLRLFPQVLASALFFACCIPSTSADIALAEQSPNTIALRTGDLLVKHRSQFSGSEKKRIRQWLTTSANATALLTGSLPLPQTTVQIFRYNEGSSPVPWANTVRSEPEGVNFYINPSLDLQTFNADWTAVHEFAHLYLPYLGGPDRWLSEGFASYYQNVLMARADLQSSDVSWNKLAAGFTRGTQDRNQDITLAELSRDMGQKRGHMRVYWSGALFFLEADIRLRQSGSSLDQVIEQFADCCRLDERSAGFEWDGFRLMQHFDEIIQQDLFLPMYERYRHERRFPDHRLMLAQLGVSHHAGKLRLDNTQPYVLLRSAIMNPSSTARP